MAPPSVMSGFHLTQYGADWFWSFGVGPHRMFQAWCDKNPDEAEDERARTRLVRKVILIGLVALGLGYGVSHYLAFRRKVGPTLIRIILSSQGVGPPIKATWYIGRLIIRRILGK